MTIITIQALHQTAEGHCALIDLEVTTDRKPTNGYANPCRHAGETVIVGWGSLDGLADVWESAETDPDKIQAAILIPRLS